ncbi:hypothetical protein ONE63_009682 [Megalurothrips usitatus]|uniref:Exocyst complex component 8 n=1 Tax=Megalurothrips usitatus TaxID=439358 RepID=A0AAV7XJI7_9NEOP|nr:hypothetical protein ONE63_009682 [Megalurothrips usitatus]
MAEIVDLKIGSSDFHPDKYVRELSQRCVGGQELQQQYQKIQGLGEETSALLKRNVYQNYTQFIETAKEISHLESEMYQLSHLLTEQRSLLSALASTSLLGSTNAGTAAGGENVNEPTTKPEQELQREDEERRRKLTAALEKVEGCVDLIESPARSLVHEGDLLELEPTEGTAMQRMHAFLFNDGLLLAPWIPNRRGPARYKFQTLIELGSFAAVNVRDMGSVKTAFKLLAFPDTRLFQCTSNQSKKEWLEKFESAKKAALAQEQPKRQESVATSETSPIRSGSIDSSSGTNPFEESSTGVSSPDVAELPEWLLELPEDLDVCIAQRHFEDAYLLLQKANQFSFPSNKDPHLLEIRRKVDGRARALIEVLMKELEVSPDKSLQGGLRAARRAVRLLNQLGRSSQACDLFLKLCSSILKTQLRRVKREGATVVYVKHLGGIFFSNMMDMAGEFLRAFPNSPSCASALVVWAGSELTHLTSHLVKQVFMPQSPISTLSECVVSIRGQCDQLCELGIDLRYQLDGLLRAPLQRALSDARDKAVEAVKLRAAEDKWRPTNLGSKDAVTKFVMEIGLSPSHMQKYVQGESWIALSGSTIALTRQYLSLLEDCLKLCTTELIHIVDQVLTDVFYAQLVHFEGNLQSDKTASSEKQFIQKNAAFLLNELLPLVTKTYQDRLGNSCQSLEALRAKFAWMKPSDDEGVPSPAPVPMQRPTPAPRTTAPRPTATKYSTVTEYI